MSGDVAVTTTQGTWRRCPIPRNGRCRGRVGAPSGRHVKDEQIDVKADAAGDVALTTMVAIHEMERIMRGTQPEEVLISQVSMDRQSHF